MTSPACWTCCVRKKKCPGPSIDSPGICTTCTTLSITCYGFGVAAKPSWLDDSTPAAKREREQRMEEIRSGVKRTTDGLRRLRALSGKRRHGQHRGENRATEWIRGPRDSLPEKLSLCQTSSSGNSPLTASTSTSVTGLLPCASVVLNSHLEAIVLMHYLDVIIPLQFPFYQPSVEDGGRGWMLALLLQTRPLYDAALSLATWHRSATMRRKLGDGSSDREVIGSQGQAKRFEYEQQLYGRAVAGLRERIEMLSQKGADEGLKDSIEVLACIVQLILLEVTKGDMENWRTHLLAAPDLHVFLRTYCTQHHLLSESTTFYQENCITDGSKSSLSLVDHAAMEFFSGVIIWFDILGSASTGLRPQYADICAAALGDVDSRVQLQNLMGCENWAMTIIREIAVLEDWKRGMERDGVLSIRELVRNASDIEHRLKIGIAGLTEKLSLVSNLHGAHAIYSSRKCSKDLVVSRITHVFACAAHVYLTVVVSGPNPNLPEMRDNVARTLAAFNSLPDAELIRSVVWPFCIAGCMAAHDQEQSFRDIVTMARIDEHTFGPCWKAVEVMETCWMMRRSSEMAQTGSDWFSAMQKLRSHVLLL